MIKFSVMVLFVELFIIISIAAKSARIVCYYNSKAVSRPSVGRYTAENIPEDQCTHLVYASVSLNVKNWTVDILDWQRDVIQNGFLQFTNLKKRSPQQLYHISLNNWGVDGSKLSQMISKKERRSIFIQSIIDFIKKYEFDGVLLDSNHLKTTHDNEIPSNKDDFLSFIKELRTAFNAENKNWEITIEGPVEKDQISRGYHVKELCRILNAVYINTFELRGSWTGFTDVPSPLFRRPHDNFKFKTLNVNDSMQIWVDLGCPPHKLNVGIPMFGQTYTLAGLGTGIGVPLKDSGTGKEGLYTRTLGYKSYYEICSDSQKTSSGWEREWDDIGKSPYVYKGNQWIGYEDVESIQFKVDWLKTAGYAGAVLYSIDMDDFYGACGSINPLLHTVYANLIDYQVPTDLQQQHQLESNKFPCNNIQIHFHHVFDGTEKYSKNSSDPEFHHGYEYIRNVGYYKIHEVRNNWNNARRTCYKEGAHLIILNSQKEFDAIKTLYRTFIKKHNIKSESIFVGVHDLFENGEYLTVKGEPLSSTGYHIWGYGQPDNYQNNEHCIIAVIRTDEGWLNDIPCTDMHYFVCEKEINK